MKLSVSAFRAQASAQRKILSSYQNQLNYGACTSFPALGTYTLDQKAQMMVDNTGINSNKPHERPQHSEGAQRESESTKMEGEDEASEAVPCPGKREETVPLEKSPGRSRSKSNQRWMKLRTTVQLSGAISSTNQKSKPPLKREDSFLKRFSTRQIPETQETVDTGDETETHNGSQAQNEVNRRRRKRRKEMSKTVVNPDENFFFYWLMTVTVCVLYNLWTLIVRQSFPELQAAASAFWYSGDGFTDVVFVCDIMVQFRTGYLEQGLMVYNSKKLASHYLKSRAFILDVLSLLPLDFLQLNLGVNPILRFPRFLKVYRVYSYYYMVESRTVYPNLWRVVNLIHILLILAHWFGCFYYLLSEAEGFQGDWVYPHRPGDYATLTRKYLGSLYWSTLTLTTIGDLPTPETNAESRGRSKAMTASGQSEGIPRRGLKSRLLQFNSNYGYLFTIVSYLIGVFIFATIVGQVGNVITNRNANRLEFERLLDGAKTYMRHHKVPGGMKRRVLRWYDYSWSRGRIQGGGDINTALGLLPDKLKTELALHVNLSVLKKVTIFQECQPEFLHDLVLKMKAYIFTPGDLICRKGEVAREMFIIADGILDVISETGRVLTTMKAGDFFGEIGILNLDGLNKRTADVRSVGYSELFSLSREDVLTAMKDYPEAQEILQSLGRKRLMEAKNSSKMYKPQVRQAKDHDSSGDSDTAGKRIVEKLRSDVKGLKNALRRSRRGTRTKETMEGGENLGAKTSRKKHSILRRMSHVQSSDECEAPADVETTPIGAGLPLLQRLKILKEKQEKEREEKEKQKSSVLDGNQIKRTESGTAPETAVGTGLPFTQKLKLLKQKEGKEPVLSGFTAVPSTVRTQVTGVQLDKSAARTKTLRQVADDKPKEEKTPPESITKVSVETEKIPLKERLILVPAKEKILPPKTLQEEEPGGDSKSTLETQFKTSINVPVAREADNSVPKVVRNTLEVPVSKDGWKLLKVSSISCSKSDRKLKSEEIKSPRKVSQKGTYLSKSDTILEKQKTVQPEEEKRSRSISPTDRCNSQEKTPEELTRENEKSRSVAHSSEAGEHKEDVSFWDLSNSSVSDTPKFSEGENLRGRNNEESKQNIKKYNSISDLSPEYSGLPFVKKLKILNERQKLEELEKELLVRSVSLDVPERSVTKRGNILVRSRSEASTMEYKSDEGMNMRIELDANVQNEASLSENYKSKPYCESSNLIEEKKCESSIPRHPEGSIASPESNETLERRHLKSILKKLSAEGSTSDEDKISKNFRRGSRKDESTEFRKLMREPTMEGYVARHKKLTKSVTFDSDTLPSPLDAVLEQPVDEVKGKGYTPMSPTAILTLQLSNLSMIPIAGPKKSDPFEGNLKEEKSFDKGNVEALMTMPKSMTHLQEEGPSLKKLGTLEVEEKENILMPYFLQEFIKKKIGTLPFMKNQDDDFFREVEGGIVEILVQLLEKAENKYESQFSSLHAEVKKRDDIIAQLQSKIQDLEKKYPKKFENAAKAEFLKRNAENSATDSDLSDVPFQREDSSETIRHVSPPVSFSTSDRKTTEDRTFHQKFFPGHDLSDFDYLGNVLSHDELKSNAEDVCEVKDNICLLPNDAGAADFLKFRRGKPFEQTSDDEVELEKVAKPFRASDLKRKRHRSRFQLKRNVSMDETYLTAVPRSEKFARKGGNTMLKGSFMNRVTGFQRSFSCTQEESSDFIALDIGDDSSNSSDVETLHNKDWEVEMLVKELAKNDPYWVMKEEEWEQNVEHLDDVKKLREEVDTLKRVVCDSDLSQLTSSEFDILERIIDAKDQKISQIAKSNSLDDDGKSGTQKRAMYIFSTGSDYKLKNSEQVKKPSLRRKIGQALSFDFHDIESRRPKFADSVKHRRLCLKAQKTIDSHREHQSLYNLWHMSSRLRNRVLDDSEKIIKNVASSKGSSQSSQPVLLSTSLPVLSARQTSGDVHLDSDVLPSREPVLEDQEASIQTEMRNLSFPSTSGGVRLNESHANSSLNSFIKSVGQKVKQVMAGDVNTVRSQVPTISKMLEEQPKGPDASVAENIRSLSGVPSEENMRSIESENGKVLGSFDRDPKSNPPDL